jgi:uncharacterized repeat protein (TIGR01451 family)
MKKINQFKRKPLARWIAFSLAAATVVGVAQAAAPLAGTEIKNLATVTYEDENGNTYTAQSNEAVITVAPQYKATMENDRTQSAAPGSAVYFPHTLVNTGNIADVYDLAVDQGAKIYADTNGNGQPDPGEPEITSINLAAGETANVVVAYNVPANAANGSSVTMTLSATSKNGGTVDDLAANNGADGTEGTSTDVVNVTTGPVLVLNKESSFNAATNEITYTLTVKNTGGSDAVSVDILDALPKVDTNGDGTLDTQVSLVPNSIVTNGLLDAGDSAAALTDEATLAVDVDGDGNTDATSVIRALDAVISPNTTISVEYKVQYQSDWAAGADIDNTFTAFEDPDGDHRPPPNTNPPTSNTTHDDVPQNYAVDADDNDGKLPSPGVNDGGDDDATDDNTQFVDKVAAGDTVIFKHTVTNNGNGDDIFNVNVANDPANGGFPAGTVFTYWNADGTVQLSDSDGDGKPDTGVLTQGQELPIIVKATLPSGITSAAGTNHTANLTATSSGDNTVADTTELKLGEITPPAVDLAARGATQGNTGFNDDGSVDAHDEGPVLLRDAVLGGTVSFPMTVANESGSPDSFLLSYGNNLPAGWTVVFKDTNGNTITATPFLPAGGTFDFTAEVTLSNDPTQALGNADRNGDVDGHDTNDDGINNVANMADKDGDKDYVITFTVASSVDVQRADSIDHAVDVTDSKAVTITPDGQNQVQPGGTVDYPHKLRNDGNVDEAIEIVPGNSDADWSSTTLVDTDGDGVGDTELANLKAGDSIKVYNADGTTSDLILTDADTDGKVEFALKPGQYIKLTNKVFAPADAPQGDVNTTTLRATDTNGTERNMAQDTSTVILGQVRLDKKVALDANCDNVPDGPFAAIQNAQVEPGQCAVWEIFAKNEGDALVKNVVVTDSVPAYTTYLANSLRINGSTPTDAEGDDAGEIDATNKISYYLGTNPAPATKQGGELQSGESATVRFTVKVDE